VTLAASPPEEPAVHAGPAPAARPRIEFLDALRGLAAITVAIQHFTDTLSTPYLKWSIEEFRPGEWGVIVFFLTSGYIIPVSLERYKSVPKFWIGRFFRLYPVYWAISAAAVALYFAGRFGLSPDLRLHWVRALGANGTMAQEFIGQPHVLGQAWTLSYELVFYATVSVLFLVGQANRPARPALLWFGGALLFGAVPVRLLIDGSSADRLAVIGLAVACAVVAAAATRGGMGERLAAASLTGVVVLLVANRTHPLWFSALLFGSMFLGWVMRQWSTGGMSDRKAVAMVGTAVAAVILAHLIHFETFVEPRSGAVTSARAEILTFLVAYAVFLGGLMLRAHSFPWFLRWLGQISYSVYLVHGVVLAAVPRVGGTFTTVVVWLAVTLAVSVLTYRFIEKPFQEMGRRVAKRSADRATARSDAEVSPAV